MFVSPTVPLYVVPSRPSRVVAYQRRRMLALLVLALFAVGLVLAVRTVTATLGGVPASAPEGPFPHAGTRVVVVQPGDTVWSIARSLVPEGDIRGLVDDLVASHDGALQPGDRLLVPETG
jgi:LysM domain